MTQQQSFATWLTEGLSRRGYDLDRHGERSRFARDAGLSESTVSRLIRGTAAPDVRACPLIARVLGCKSTHVLVAAGLIPDEEDDATPRPRFSANRQGSGGASSFLRAHSNPP